MARYGFGYKHNFDNIESLNVYIERGLEEALDETAEILKEHIQEDIIKPDLYDSYMPEHYDRLGYNGGVIGSLSYVVDKMNCGISFFFDDNKIDVYYNHHTYLRDGISTVQMAENVWRKDRYHQHNDIIFNIKQYLIKYFPIIYREVCQKYGLQLE